jgi:DNA polymerase-3 subunit delta'
MNLDRILGQHDLKDKIYSSIKKNTYPQSKIIIDKDGYGGLNLAIEIARGLLENSSFSGDVLDHPDLYFSFPSFASLKDNDNIYNEWLGFVKKHPFSDFQKWSSFAGNTSSQGSIKVSEVDKIQKKAVLKSFLGGNKVFVFWGAETMMAHTSNKLLKILEEPPKNTFFILITNSIQDVLPTIISRCQISTLKPIGYEDHLGFLQSSFDGIEHRLVVNSSRGSIARSMNYIEEDVASISHEQNFIECLRFAFLAKKSKKAILDLTTWAERISSNSREQQKEFLGYCSFLVREAMLVSYKSQNLNSFLSSSNFKIENLAPFIHSNNLIEIIRLIEDSHYSVSRNVNSKIVFTNLAIHLTKLINLSED